MTGLSNDTSGWYLGLIKILIHLKSFKINIFFAWFLLSLNYVSGIRNFDFCYCQVFLGVNGSLVE